MVMMVDLALMLSIRYPTEIEWGALSGSWAYKNPTLTLRELPISLLVDFKFKILALMAQVMYVPRVLGLLMVLSRYHKENLRVFSVLDFSVFLQISWKSKMIFMDVFGCFIFWVFSIGMSWKSDNSFLTVLGWSYVQGTTKAQMFHLNQISLTAMKNIENKFDCIWTKHDISTDVLFGWLWSLWLLATMLGIFATN